MAFASGTVEDMAELMTTLRNFVTGAPGTPGRDWEVEVLRPTRNSDNSANVSFATPRHEWVVSNIGENGLEKVIVGVREYEYPANDEWGCNLNCYTSFNPDGAWNQNALLHKRTAYDTARQSFWEHPLLPLSNSTMAYWFFSNRNRFIVVVRTASYYQSAYVGFGIRQASPSEYPYPLVAIGTVNGYRGHKWTDLVTHSRFFADPYLLTISSSHYNAPFVVDPMGGYSTYSQRPPWNNLLFRPGYDDALFTLSNQNYQITYGADDKIMMFPIYVSMSGNVLMTFDGVQRVAFQGLQSEDVLVYNNEEWIAFQDTYRVNIQNFMAINSGVPVTE